MGQNGIIVIIQLSLKYEKTLLMVQKVLNQLNIFPRRYFYPSLNILNYVDYKEMPISEYTASRIMCLPLAHNIKPGKVEIITREINSIPD